jgi:hypothetical protein
VAGATSPYPRLLVLLVDVVEVFEEVVDWVVLDVDVEVVVVDGEVVDVVVDVVVEVGVPWGVHHMLPGGYLVMRLIAVAYGTPVNVTWSCVVELV